MKKRVLAMAMTLAMALSLLPVSALAAEASDNDAEIRDAQMSGDITENITSAVSGDTITLTGDATFSGFTLSDDKQLTIDLNGHKLSATTTNNDMVIYVTGGADLTICNTGSADTGVLELNGYTNVTYTAIGIAAGSSVTLEDLTYNSDATGLGPDGEKATVNVDNCTVSTSGYCLGTNAGTSENYGVVITLVDSIFNGDTEKTGTAMYLNVPGTLDMDNCEVNGHFHGMFIRGGTAVIKNSTITNTLDDGGENSNYFDNRNWGTGNMVNLAALTLGDKSAEGSTSYQYPTNVTLENTTVQMAGSAKDCYPAIYLYQMDDSQRQVTLNITGDDSWYIGDISINNANEEGVTANISIEGGTFDEDVSQYVPENFECVGNKDGTYTVKELDGKLAVDTNTEGDSVSGTLEGTFVPGAAVDTDNVSEGSKVDGDDVVVDLATGGEADKTTTTLTVTETTAGSLSEANSLTVKTDVADVTLDSDALTEVSKAGSQVSIKVEKVTAASTEAAAYTVTVEDDAGNLLPYGEDAGWVTISVPAGKLGEVDLNTIQAWYVTGDKDNRVYLEKLDITNREGGITYRMNHLSTSVLTTTTPTTAEAIITDKDGDVTGYNTISGAISNAADGDKITLQRDASTNTFDIGKDITLNLGGHELTVGNGKGVIYVKDGDLSIQNGTVKGLVEVRTSGTDAKYNHLTVGKDVVIDAPSYYALILRESSVGTHSDSYGSTIDVYGRLYGDVWVQGNITTDLAQATHPCVITIHDGAVIDATELDENLGIAVNGAAKVIVNGGTIRGETGIEVRAGQLEVNGGTITGTGTPTTVTPNGNGSTSTGVGIAVAQHTTGLPISVTIKGGNISGYSAFYESNTQDSTQDELKKITINIEDGEFEATKGGTQVVYSQNFTGFVDGGSFSDSVEPKYLDSTLNAVLKKASGDTPYSYYHSYADATKDAGPGDTITAVNQQEDETYWRVTFRYNDGVSADTTAEVMDGETVKMPSNPRRSGYTFNGWYSGSTYVGKAGTTAKISADTVFTASWTKNYDPDDRPSSGSDDGPSGDYIVNVDRSTGGTVTVNPGRADRGDTVTVTVRPKDGYVLDELTVTDSRGNEVELDAVSDTRFTFEMPSGTVRVKADFVRAGQTTQPETPVSGMPYTDVARDAWYFNAVRYAYEKGLMTGVSDTQFGPNVTLTRAQLVQILYALEGKPAVTASAGYADVNAGDWYADAVNWAAANGVVSGVGDNRFAPNDALTREQLSVILYSYTRFKGYDATQGGMAVREYDDYSSISPWAAQGVEWAVNAGLISSVGENLLSPAGTATRAQAAQVLMNFCETVAQ